MNADSVVFWLFVTAWVVLAGALLLVVLPSAVREARRILARVLAIVDGAPLALEFAKAESDMKRLSRAIDRLPGLQQRALNAFEVMRETPLVPPAINDVRSRIARELRAFTDARS